MWIKVKTNNEKIAGTIMNTDHFKKIELNISDPENPSIVARTKDNDIVILEKYSAKETYLSEIKSGKTMSALEKTKERYDRISMSLMNKNYNE